MKKIAFIATSFIAKYDGISVYTENILKELIYSDKLVNNKFYVDIYVGKSVFKLLTSRILQDNIVPKNVNFIIVNDTSFLKKTISTIIELRTNKDYSLVFIPNFTPICFFKSEVIEVIHDFTAKHYPELNSWWREYYHDILLKHAQYFHNSIGYISKTTKEDLYKFNRINEINKSLIYLPNGIPFKVKQYARPDMNDIEQKYHLNELELLVVGRINRHKGFDRILEFCAYYDKKLKNSNLFKKVILHIVGKQTDETKTILEDLNLQNITLLFHGFADDLTLNSLYKKAHFCFFLSRNEGYGLPLIEAMWFRCVPILSNIPIFNEIMGNDYPKFDDKSGYGQAIEEFIEKIFLSKVYRENIFEKIEKIVEKESDGYKIAANNLLTYIDSITNKGSK